MRVELQKLICNLGIPARDPHRTLVKQDLDYPNASGVLQDVLLLASVLVR